MLARIAPILLATLVLAACGGPKDTCEGSYQQWTKSLKNHDWDNGFELLTPEFKRKVVSAERMANGMEGIWNGAKSFSFTVYDIAETSSGICTAAGEMSYTIKIRGSNPEDIEGEYFAWMFKRGKDGLWYIELPGSEKIGAF